MISQSQHCSHFTHVDSLQDGYKCPLPFTKRTGPEDLYRVCSLLDTHNSAFKLQMIDSISFVLNKWLEMVCCAVLNLIWLFETPWRAAPRLLCPWDFPGKNTGVGCHSLLQGIFLAQGSNLCLLHCRRIFYCVSHQENPLTVYWKIIP